MSPPAAASIVHERLPPAPRPELVPRQRLLGRLMDARQARVVLLTAPAGYGKTTLLEQWAASDERCFAWVTLDEHDNDVTTLLSAVVVALDAIEPVSWDVFEALSERPVEDGIGLRRMARHLSRRDQPMVLVLDDLHVLRNRGARQAMKAIWAALAPGSQLALASRSEAGLPVGRLRAQGSSIELRSTDLALTRSEASELLSRAGLELSPEQGVALTRRTEGWPAGLYLAALSLREQQGSRTAVEGFSGDDPLVSDYVREEVLSTLSAGERQFLTRTSVLDQLSAPLCDAVLERDDSAELLAALARSNALLVGLDRCGAGYRHHRLLADVLRAELGRRDPADAIRLHQRAGAWFAQQGDPERAIHHAVEAHDVAGAGRLLWAAVLPRAAQGRKTAIADWLARFSAPERAGSPALALVAAAASLALGNLEESAHWTAIAEVAAPEEPDDFIAGGLAMMRASLGRRGVESLRADAGRARALLAESSPWNPLCRFLEGVACHLQGEPGPAAAHLEEGAHRATLPAPMVHALCLSQLALVVADEGDHERAETLAARARAQVERYGLGDCPALALVFAVSAVFRAHRGQVAEARSDLQQALVLLERIVDPSPWYDAECRILFARAALRLTGPAPASELVEGAARALGRTAGAAVLSTWLDDVRGEVDLALDLTAGADWSLTSAEVRVLRYLPSHLSFREIAELLYVSPNTVKTHARAIYRKLGVSSRAHAVNCARGAGLVDPMARR